MKTHGILMGLPALLALLIAVGVEGVHRPPGLFLKYPQAVEAAAEVQAERALDYSPLYLGLTQVLHPLLGQRSLLIANALFLALAAAAIALAVSRLSGWRWGLAAGLLTASYRPLLTHSAIHEPELLLTALFAIAVAGAVIARERLAQGAWDGQTKIAVGCAGLAVSLAGLARPQWMLLVPLWALWIGLAAQGKQRRRLIAGLLVLGLLVVGPVALSRSLQAGFPVIMNPGPVIYEGNHPAAAGIASYPLPVQALASVHPESTDYGHVAYRRIASSALGREVNASETNSYWGGLLIEGLRDSPARALRLFGRKALMAVMPYEAHDLRSAEDFSRKVRARWPWGFGLLLISVPWLLALRRETLMNLAGPVGIAAIAFLVQVAIYPSARQRLPLAVAFLVLAPVLTSELWKRRLRGTDKRRLHGLLGLSFAVLIAWLSGPVAILEQVSWDRSLRKGQRSTLEHVSRVLEGAVRPELAEDARVVDTSLRLIDARRVSRVEPFMVWLAELEETQPDMTTEGGRIRVPAYWSARGHLLLGQPEQALEAARRAVSVRPGDIRVEALARWLELGPESMAGENGEAWRPPGVSPLEASWALAEAAMFVGDKASARAFIGPWLEDLPELWPKGQALLKVAP